MIIYKSQVICRSPVAAQQHPTLSPWSSLLACIIQTAAHLSANGDIPSDFHLNPFGKGRPPHSSEPDYKNLFLFGGQFSLPGETWAEGCIEGQGRTSRRKNWNNDFINMQPGSCVLFKEFQGGGDTVAARSRTKQIWELILADTHAPSDAHWQTVYSYTSDWLSFMLRLFMLGCTTILFLHFNVLFLIWHFHLNKSVKLCSVTDCHKNNESHPGRVHESVSIYFSEHLVPCEKLHMINHWIFKLKRVDIIATQVFNSSYKLGDISSEDKTVNLLPAREET